MEARPHRGKTQVKGRSIQKHTGVGIRNRPRKKQGGKMGHRDTETIPHPALHPTIRPETPPEMVGTQRRKQMKKKTPTPNKSMEIRKAARELVAQGKPPRPQVSTALRDTEFALRKPDWHNPPVILPDPAQALGQVSIEDVLKARVRSRRPRQASSHSGSSATHPQPPKHPKLKKTRTSPKTGPSSRKHRPRNSTGTKSTLETADHLTARV